MTQREKIIKKDLRGQICRIISAMLDNPDKYGIYPTTKCYDELEDLFSQQKQEIIRDAIEFIESESGKSGRKEIIEYLKQKLNK
ncbi:MAG: hypothetical protein PHV11_09750 [Candidatus Bipolaricaulis sp.]|nr:hypothetical protein [Candidatus Bipolaricaulis sp.]